jgi:hypothetical protein
MKATYQLNQEKLEYNYQVLQKREEENVKTKAQQKRKITKLQDVLTNLKKKLTKQVKTFNDENQMLAEEYKRVTDMFNDMQLKSQHFLGVDLKKFHDIWKMNEDQCKTIAHNLLEADRIIHEQQLGLEWTPPDMYKKKFKIDFFLADHIKIALKKQKSPQIKQKCTQIYKRVAKKCLRGSFVKFGAFLIVSIFGLLLSRFV